MLRLRSSFHAAACLNVGDGLECVDCQRPPYRVNAAQWEGGVNE